MHDGRDLRVVDQLDRIGEGARAVAIRQGLRGLGPRVGDGGEPCARHPLGDDSGVRGADPAGADQSDHNRYCCFDGHVDCLSTRWD